MSKYDPPEWSCTPVYACWLEILKEGVIIGKIELSDDSNKPFFVLGRQADAVDVVLEHPSISRQHAVLQHGPQGLYLYDLDSVQGTYVNKERVDARQHRKLHVGDLLRFGASTRLYIVSGPDELRPPEYDSENMQRFRLKAATFTKQQVSVQSEGVSWGFGEDAQADSDEEEGRDRDEDKKQALPHYIRDDENYERKYGSKYSSGLDEVGVLDEEKDKALLEKVRKREAKIRNMQEENRKIYLKEGAQENGLTEGQMSAVQRNDGRIAVLTEEVEALLGELRGKASSRERSSAGRGAEMQQKGTRHHEEEEVVLDTTGETADRSTNWRLRRREGARREGARREGAGTTMQRALGYEELCRLKQEQEALHEALSTKLATAERALAVFASASEADVDPLEWELARATREDDAAAARTLQEQVSAARAKVDEYNKLIRIAAPALASMHKTAPSVQAEGLPAEPPVPLPTKTEPPLQENTKKRAPHEGMQSLANFLEFARQEKAAEGEEATGSAAPKRRKVIGPTARPGASIASSSGSTLEGGEAVWVPPANQSGDGRTALNDKFGY